MTGDGQFFCLLGWDSMREKRNITVVHTKKGIVVNKIQIK